MEKNVKKNVKSKKNKNIYYAKTTEQQEMRNFLIVIVVVLVCVAAIYFITRAFVTKDLFKKDEPKVEEVTPGSINYGTIIMGMIMNRPDEEYYVVIYDKTAANASEMSSLVTKYNSGEKHLPVYTVDLSNKTMNASYYDPNNISQKPKTLQEIKVGDRTLIKIKKGEIQKFIPDMLQQKDKDGAVKLTSNFEAIEKELTPSTSKK